MAELEALPEEEQEAEIKLIEATFEGAPWPCHELRETQIFMAFLNIINTAYMTWIALI